MIELYVAIGVLDAVALAALISLPGRWAWKAAAIGVAFLVNLGLLAAVPDVSGRATGSSPPDDSTFIACAVDEPRYVYLWLVDDAAPRAFRVAYSRDLHEVCLSARRAVSSGVAVGLRRFVGDPGARARFRPYQLPPLGQPKEGGE